MPQFKELLQNIKNYYNNSEMLQSITDILSDPTNSLTLTGIALLFLLALVVQKRRRIQAESLPKSGKKNKKSPLDHGTKVKVLRVIDGDTFEAALDGGTKIKIRVLGIDTPESKRNKKARQDAERDGVPVEKQVIHGKKATVRATKLLTNKKVTLEAKAKTKQLKPDLYGRYLGYVRLRYRRDYGLMLIKEGLALDFGWKYPHPRKAKYLKVEAAAKKRYQKHRV